ncbi:hypothetical protein D8B26_007044 [Coccidioides posadasii str. Silveira]|uniref:DUF7924 domain-containing protein n=1 Tax=Coccidioides posadasii (strain RMSCC 757 / Silveira) TaxID=443226 RepID=E9DH00_COCPS|nr:conserved hypothetical protein [Coccidioides posadasii str. Silveira]QVM12415.1 hypothetical protein D8B26_007044 [Coccidioides posadasii str. Silveira]
MGQYFHVIAPKLREKADWGWKLGEILFDGTPASLVYLFARPIIPPTFTGHCCTPDSESLSKTMTSSATINAPSKKRGYLFGNLAHLTDDTLSRAKPDHFYGARPEQLNRQIRKDLSDQIIPSTQDDLPMAPNFFLEAKGPDGSLAVATRQACYDGALGARGMHSLQTYRQDKLTYDNNAYTITSTYHGGQLKLYVE